MTGARFVLAMCVAQVGAMLGFAAFPALLPAFLAEWNLSNTEAGWINGLQSAGYMAAVLVLAPLTDRVAARRVFAGACAVLAASSLGFALLADGFWSALALRTLGGIGLAGMYVPGLKGLSDATQGPGQSRAVSFYTSAFSIGTALSLGLTGWIAARWGWRAAFAVAGVAPLAAAALAWAVLPARAPQTRASLRAHDLRPVFRNRTAMGYVAAYACHMWELFGMRTWLVAYLAFAIALDPAAAGWSAPAVAAAATLAGLFAGIAGNEVAMRIGVRRWLALAMLSSAAFSAAFGFLAGLPFAALAVLAFLYCFACSWDSAAINASVIRSAAPGQTGATLAVQQCAGFLAGTLSPLAFGAILDLAGGNRSALAWGLAFAAMGAGVALGPLALARWAR